MSLTASQIRTVTDAPALVPYRFGLFSQIDFESNGRELFGLTWESRGCVALETTTDPCIDTEVAAKTPGTACVIGEADGFTVYYYDTASVAGDEVDYHVERARERFLGAEQHAVEEYFHVALNDYITAQSYTPFDATALVTQTGVTGPQALLAAGEQLLADNLRSQGVLHMNRLTASLLTEELVQTGGGLFTRLGTPVVAGGGYGPVDGDFGIIGTGPLVGVRGAVEVSTAVDRSINSVSIVLERTYSIGWDCSLVAAVLGTNTGEG